MTTAVPEWKLALRAAADEAYDAEGEHPAAGPEFVARVRRRLYRAGSEAQQAA